MKTVLLGYGKMGKAIEALAIEQGHEVIGRFSSAFPATDPEMLSGADVAIEFSRPESAVPHIMLALEAGIPIVCGTTGWNREFDRVSRLVTEQKGALLFASNFSIGMNVLFLLNKQLARIMDSLGQYNPLLTETHHTQKVDSPSGTAITLAEQVVAVSNRFFRWVKSDGQVGKALFPIQSIREGEVKGIHTLTWLSQDDRITISHEALSRDAFAKGALHAAEWIIGKQGVFSFEDILRESMDLRK